MKQFKSIIIGLFFCAIFACNSPQNSKEYEMKSLTFVAEGPLFEGANTAQCELINPLNEISKSLGIESDKIQSIELISANINAPNDSSNLNLYDAFTLSFMADNSGMIKAGVANPVPENSKTISLQTAQKNNNLLDLFKNEKLIMIIDANIKNDLDENITLLSNLTLKITY